MSDNNKDTIPISVCIVNYNGEPYLEDSLGSISAQKDKFAEVLLIDNASEDRSLEIVRSRFHFVKVVALRENMGPSAARNAGFRAAICDRVLFLDNDVCLAPGCTGELMRALDEDPDAAAAMPRVLYDNNKEVIQYDGANSHCLGLMILENENLSIHKADSKVKRIHSIVTACFLIDRRAFRNHDFFDESIFMYYEDHDFGYRIRTSGHDILSVPSAWVYHKEGTKGLSLRQSGQYATTRIYGLIRNRWLILFKNFEWRTLFFLAPLLIIYELLQLAGVIKKGWLIQWLQALFWIMTHIPVVLRKRNIVQQTRNTPDRDILQGGPIPFSQYLLKSPWERKGKNLLDRLASAYWKKAGQFV